MKRYLCITGSLLCLQFAMAQPSRTLTIGDKLPDSIYQKIQNYPAIKGPVPDLKGKWLILDFMSTGCGSCVSALPHFNSFQEKYRDQLQIVLVTNQSVEKLNAYTSRSRNHVFRNSKLPVLPSDTLLANMFPFIWLSHEVWIDPNGIVKAITYSEYINERNIEWALSGKPFNLPLKVDKEHIYYDPNKPLVNPAPPCFYSALLPYNNDLLWGKSLHRDSTTGNSRLSIVNFGLIQLYRFSIGKPELQPAQIILKVQDTSRLICDKLRCYWNEWQNQYSYGYEATFPPGILVDAIKKKLKDDLDAWFKINSSFQKQTVDCYVLKEIPGFKASTMPQPTEDGLDIEAIIFYLNERYFCPPAIDEWKNKAKLPTNIPVSSLKNIEGLNKQLSYYGLELVKEPREIMMLTIADAKQAFK